MCNVKPNPCRTCGNDILEVTYAPDYIMLMCIKCGRTQKTIPKRFRSYTSVARCRKYLMPTAIAEWNAYSGEIRKLKEDDHAQTD